MMGIDSRFRSLFSVDLFFNSTSTFFLSLVPSKKNILPRPALGQALPARVQAPARRCHKTVQALQVERWELIELEERTRRKQKNEKTERERETSRAGLFHFQPPFLSLSLARDFLEVSLCFLSLTNPDINAEKNKQTQKNRVRLEALRLLHPHRPRRGLDGALRLLPAHPRLLGGLHEVPAVQLPDHSADGSGVRAGAG